MTTAQHDAQRRADARRFRRRRDAAVEHVHDADDDQRGTARSSGSTRIFRFQRVAEIRRVRAEAALPDDEQRPQHEQAGQHQARQHAGEEQPADRRLGGDAVQDERDRRRDQDAERAAGADRAGGDVVRIAAPAHLGDAHLADRRAAGGRRAGQRGEHRAGAEIRDDEPARHAVEPAVERFVEVLARGRGADRRAHHHEHRDRHQREVVQARIERLGDDVQRVEALEDHDETRSRSRRARTRPARPTAASPASRSARSRPASSAHAARDARAHVRFGAQCRTAARGR